MKPVRACLIATLMLAGTALAATPRPLSTDHSSHELIDAATAEQLWRKNLPARIKKLYPSNKFRFVSEVWGGFTESKLCVVTARAAVMPVVRLPVQGAKVMYEPVRSATAFDAKPDLSAGQCADVARGLLEEAIQSIAASLVGG